MSTQTLRFPDDPAVIAERLVERGDQVLYLRPALLPVLRAEVMLLERSRDEMGAVESTILALCGHGLGQADDIAFAMGLKPHRLRSLLEEIQNRGLIARNPAGAFGITELGRLSVQHGGEVVRARRGLLLCGLTGRPLPAAAYEAPLLEPSDLADGRTRAFDLLAEAERVPLGHLQLDAIPNKRAVNLPDETIAIEGVVADSVRPAFLRATLVLVRDQVGAERCEIHLPGLRSPIDWIDGPRAVGLLEPLGFPRHSPEEVLAALVRALEELGAGAMAARLDRFGNPAVELAEVSDRFLAARLDGRPPVLRVGAADFAALPFHRFSGVLIREPVDLLRGRTLTLTARPDTRFAGIVRVLRLLDRERRAQRRRPQNQPIAVALRQVLTHAGHTVEDARRAAELARVRWVDEAFSLAPE